MPLPMQSGKTVVSKIKQVEFKPITDNSLVSAIYWTFIDVTQDEVGDIIQLYDQTIYTLGGALIRLSRS